MLRNYQHSLRFLWFFPTKLSGFFFHEIFISAGPLSGTVREKRYSINISWIRSKWIKPKWTVLIYTVPYWRLRDVAPSLSSPHCGGYQGACPSTMKDDDKLTSLCFIRIRICLNEIMHSRGFLAKKEGQNAVTLAYFLSGEPWRKE